MNLLLKRAELALTWLSIASVVAIMVIVAADAIMRYVLNAPFPWSYELISFYLLIASIHFAVSDTFREGDHISVDLLGSMSSRKLRNFLDLIWIVGAGVVFGIISWGAFSQAASAFKANEFLPGYIAWPVWMSYFPIAIGSGVMTLRLFLHGLNLILLGHDPEVAAHGDVLE